MQHYRLALIGFGGVNRALAKIVQDQTDQTRDGLGFTLSIVAITDLAMGTWIDDEGIDPAVALALPRGASFDSCGGSAEMDNRAAIQDSAADIVAEATFTDPHDGEPATTHIQWALESGKHVITTNKGPVALSSARLTTIATDHDVAFEYEGTVMSGTPVLRLARQQLAGTTISSFEGILNGTSNYVLGRMRDGLTLDAAVAEAQGLGYAEADPSADLGGSDVRLKVAILATELFPGRVSVDDIATEGITAISQREVEEAAAEGKTWKLIGRASHDDGGVHASVSPVALDADHPLAGIGGATNAVTFQTDHLGAVTIAGPGAGLEATAYALLSDIIAIHHRGRSDQ